ncbi:MAG: hypothetical protein COB67_05520 [SAR324 cluster bacterium]|uniref:O-antigen ligase-related domain-containing protein n=1 Tax=SAR324 cluster bacterium TaxID=2024889 RepID=A0A2A4T697_9DELT|nr:MAG: hypothetical protein COB67_05520 [SAR324 cluster bacterium]
MSVFSHYLSLFLQFLLFGGISATLGIAIPHYPMVSVPVFLLLGLILYIKILLRDYHIILGAIIVVIPFNFESLIAAINISYVNPFNVLWISYVGIVLLRCATYSERLLIYSPLNLPIFFVVLSFSISFVQSYFVVPVTVLKDTIFPIFQQWLQWILFYFFCLKGVRTQKEAKQVIFWVMLMLLFAGLQNIRDYMSMLAVTRADNLERASGLFNTANYSASFFSYYVPFAVGLALSHLPEQKWRLFFAVTAGIGLVAVVVTYSRGGMASTGLACMIIAVLSKVNARKVVVLCLIAGIAFSSGNIRKRFSQSSVEGPYGEQVDPSIHARLIAWSKAFYLIREKPWIGQGFFSFRYIKIEKFEDEAAKAHGSSGMAVHNGFLNILVNAGITGLLAFVFLLVAIFRFSLKIFCESKDPYWKGVAVGFLGAIISLVLVNMSGTRLYDRQMIAYLWILAAALYRGYSFYLQDQEGETS